MKTMCPRCGDWKELALSGPYTNMLCEDCALAKHYEEMEEHEHEQKRQGRRTGA